MVRVLICRVAYDPERHGPERIVGPGFFGKVYELVARVPAGRVTTYGDIAAELGMRSVARKVGHALAALPADRDDVPWHRVVNAQGKVSRPADSPSGREQRRLLERDGVSVTRAGGVEGFADRRHRFT